MSWWLMKTEYRKVVELSKNSAKIQWKSSECTFPLKTGIKDLQLRFFQNLKSGQANQTVQGVFWRLEGDSLMPLAFTLKVVISKFPITDNTPGWKTAFVLKRS